MPTTTATVLMYDAWMAEVHNLGNNYTTDTFKMLLTTSSYSPDGANHIELSDITNELSGNGYARQTLANTGSEYSSGEGGFMVPYWDPVTFSASGGSWTAHYWVVYNDTRVGDSLICYGLIDNTAGGTDVTIADGESLTINGVGTSDNYWIRLVHS